MATHDRLSMLESLAGLSVGDAFGQRFFVSEVASKSLPRRDAPPGPWHWTDDTNMALSIVEALLAEDVLDQDALAMSFASRYDGVRGYGPAMHRLLPRLAQGADWRAEAGALFGGRGSYGNGASMRVAPLGAYYRDDLSRAVTEATRSAEVTHAHTEGVAGAVAVAVAAALAAQTRGEARPDPAEFLGLIVDLLPESEVRRRVQRATGFPSDVDLLHVTAEIGNGSLITAQDTVAFALWTASRHLDDYEEALWRTVAAGGDVDTTCAIVGGIVASRLGVSGIPKEWLERAEPLPDWASPGSTTAV